MFLFDIPPDDRRAVMGPPPTEVQEAYVHHWAITLTAKPESDDYDESLNMVTTLDGQYDWSGLLAGLRAQARDRVENSDK